MTDLEAYELLLKYAGDEKTLSEIRYMLHVQGIEKTIELFANSYLVRRKKYLPDDFKEWVRQSLTYLNNKNETKTNYGT
jgi:hypothetical protein